jgi:hypothetical protein
MTHITDHGMSHPRGDKIFRPDNGPSENDWPPRRPPKLSPSLRRGNLIPLKMCLQNPQCGQPGIVIENIAGLIDTLPNASVRAWFARSGRRTKPRCTRLCRGEKWKPQKTILRCRLPG